MLFVRMTRLSKFLEQFKGAGAGWSSATLGGAAILSTLAIDQHRSMRTSEHPCQLIRGQVEHNEKKAMTLERTRRNIQATDVRRHVKNKTKKAAGSLAYGPRFFTLMVFIASLCSGRAPVLQSMLS